MRQLSAFKHIHPLIHILSILVETINRSFPHNVNSLKKEKKQSSEGTHQISLNFQFGTIPILNKYEAMLGRKKPNLYEEKRPPPRIREAHYQLQLVGGLRWRKEILIWDVCLQDTKLNNANYNNNVICMQE